MSSLMAMNWMTNNMYDAWDAGLLNSTMQIDMPEGLMCRIIQSNQTLRVHIHGSQPRIEIAFSSMVTSIMIKDKLIFG